MMQWLRSEKRKQSRQDKALQKSLRGVTSVKGVKNISLGVNPLLASHTPVWRSQLMLACLALGFLGLAARAAYVQIIGNDFFIRQGEVRFVRTLELPANLHRDLTTYAEILGREAGQPATDPMRLIVPMLERFMATDRGFAKAKQAGSSPRRPA